MTQAQLSIIMYRLCFSCENSSLSIYLQGQYVEALQDLSAAIHLEPNQAQAFFHRAYLLRESQPKQALQDFSVSLLLDDSVTNVQAFVHRGVLYTQLTW